MNTNFKFDFVNQTIVASKTALRKASDPASKEYKELTDMMAKRPEFKVVERAIKKAGNKTTYKGLTTEAMWDYIGNDAEKMGELNKALEMGGYPMAKQWFLSTYEKPTMQKVNKAVATAQVAKVKVRAKAQPTADSFKKSA